MSFLADPSQTSDVFLSELQELYVRLSRDLPGSWAGLKVLRVFSDFWMILRGWGKQEESWEPFSP